MSKRADVYEQFEAANGHAHQLRASVDDALSVALNWTPRDDLEAKENERELPSILAAPPDERKARDVAVRVHQFILFAEFLCVGASELAWLKIRSLIMLRVAAPGTLHARFRLTVAQARAEEKRLRRSLPRFLRSVDYVPLAQVLSAMPEEDELQLALEMGLGLREYRLLRYGEFCAELANGSRDVTAFAKNAATTLRRVKQEFVSDLGESQADFSRKFNERRATVQAREKRVFEARFLDEDEDSASKLPIHLLGGTKSNGHREACALAQVGNTNRRDGLLRSRGLVDDSHYVTDRNHIPLRKQVTQADLDRLWDDHERRRIAKLAGVAPEDITLEMTGKVSEPKPTNQPNS